MKNIMIKPIMKLMGSCEDVTLLIEQSLDQSIGLFRRLKVKIHLMGCLYCRRYEQQALVIHKAMESFDRYAIEDSIQLSRGKKLQIIELMKKQKNN